MAARRPAGLLLGVLLLLAMPARAATTADQAECNASADAVFASAHEQHASADDEDEPHDEEWVDEFEDRHGVMRFKCKRFLLTSH